MTMPPPLPPYAQPIPQAPKKRNGCLIAAIVVAVVIVLGIVGVVALLGALGKGVSDVTSAEHTITYKVTTNAKTTVSYGSSSGTSQETVSAAWSKDQKVTGIEIASLTAMLDYTVADTATVTCEILVDGKSQSKNTATGKSALASCTGTTTK